MYLELIIIILVLFIFIVAFSSFLIIQQTKRKLSEISTALTDIKNGNGNRRILARENELTASLIYQINDVIQSYEDQISVFRRSEQDTKQLMTSLSHDVRTPLTTLIGYLDAVQKEIVTGKERDFYLDTAQHKAHDLKEYIDILFDWFKLNSNEFTIQIDSVEIMELTRNILADWIPILEDNLIDYIMDIPDHPFYVNLDINGYARILNNLLQNAISHGQANKIKIHLSQDTNYIKIQLSDNGIGICKEDLKHIFDRLYKCDKARSYKSSGLGLSIVYQLVEKMKGSISAESILGEGISFTIHFPISYS